jgi:hypothetical protein
MPAASRPAIMGPSFSHAAIATMFRIREGRKPSGLLVEIVMIVIGINVALWFEGWFQDLEDAETERQYLADLREDLAADTALLDGVIESNEEKLERVDGYIVEMSELVNQPPEAQATALYTPASYYFFEPSDFTFRSMQESGDFRLLSDAEIKKRILKLERRYKLIALLQSNYLDAVDDVYVPMMMQGFDIAAMEVTDPTMLEDLLFRNFFVYTKQDTESLLYQYRHARTEADELIAQIDAQLGD